MIGICETIDKSKCKQFPYCYLLLVQHCCRRIDDGNATDLITVFQLPFIVSYVLNDTVVFVVFHVTCPSAKL